MSQVGCRAFHGKLRRAARVGGGGGEQDADGRQLGRAQACKAPLGRARPAFEDGGLAQATSIWQPAQGSVGDCRRAQMREGPDELKSQIKIIGALYSVKNIYRSNRSKGNFAPLRNLVFIHSNCLHYRCFKRKGIG